MSDIKARLEKIFGGRPELTAMKGMSYSVEIMTAVDFSEWRTKIINDISKNAKVLRGKLLSNGVPSMTELYPHDEDTHTCIALDFQEIRRGVTKAEILLHLTNELYAHKDKRMELAERIQREGIV